MATMEYTEQTALPDASTIHAGHDHLNLLPRSCCTPPVGITAKVVRMVAGMAYHAGNLIILLGIWQIVRGSRASGLSIITGG